MIDTLFGRSKDLDALRVCMRAGVLFAIALVLIVMESSGELSAVVRS